MSSVSSVSPENPEIWLFGLKYENINKNITDLTNGRFVQIDTKNPVVLKAKEVGFIHFLKIKDKKNSSSFYDDESSIVYVIQVIYKTGLQPQKSNRLFIVNNEKDFKSLHQHILSCPVASGHDGMIH